MFNFLLGVLAILGLALVITVVAEKQIVVTWWQWLLIGAGFFLTLFSFRILHSLVNEDAVNLGRLVSTVFGLIAMAGATLLCRCFFNEAEA